MESGSRSELDELNPLSPKGELRSMSSLVPGAILMLKWKNKQFGFVMKNRSFSLGEGGGG
jgi:hypothetical protein